MQTKIFLIDQPKFWSKVQKTKTCWNWTGCLNKGGYGVFGIDYEIQTTHRIVWQLCKGKIPKGICVLHKCDNRKCVNPNHLFLGTYRDNNLDMIKKERGFALIRKEAMLKIKSLYKKKMSYHNPIYSQRGLAKRFKVSQATIWNIINNKRVWL